MLLCLARVSQLYMACLAEFSLRPLLAQNGFLCLCFYFWHVNVCMCMCECRCVYVYECVHVTVRVCVYEYGLCVHMCM